NIHLEDQGAGARVRATRAQRPRSRSAKRERGEGARRSFTEVGGGVCCLPRVCGVDATTLLLDSSLQVLKSRVAPQAPPPPVGRLRQADAMLRVGGDLLLEQPDRPVPIPQQRVGKRGPLEQLPLRIDLRVFFDRSRQDMAG